MECGCLWRKADTYRRGLVAEAAEPAETAAGAGVQAAELWPQ